MDAENVKIDPNEAHQVGSLQGVDKHAQIIAWASHSLRSQLLDMQVVANTPWSKVLRLQTQDGVFYLKQPTQSLYLEVDVIHACADLGFKAFLPEIINENAELHCFLMKAVGDTTVRNIQDPQLRESLFSQSISIYRRMQDATAACVSRLLDIGVPDWRLERLPEFFIRMLDDRPFMAANQMDSSQIKTLERLAPVISDMTTELRRYSLPACMNQSDFHDNNVVWDRKTGSLCLIDLGEATVDHPFFSLASTLLRFCHRHHIEIGTVQYQRLKAACFEGWLASSTDMAKAIAIVNNLLPLYSVMTHKRLLDATMTSEMQNITRMRTRIPDALRKLIFGLS